MDFLNPGASGDNASAQSFSRNSEAIIIIFASATPELSSMRSMLRVFYGFAYWINLAGN